MISRDDIRTIANKYQTTELNVRREYFQHLFLLYFYQQPQSSTVFFKGGTALRIIYQSPRFSEDLDFSTPLHDSRPIEQAILQTLIAIEREGINTQLKEAKKTSGGYLSSIAFRGFEQSVEIILEFSFRDKPSGEVITVASDFIPPYPVIRLAQEQLIAEKIQALLNRSKPRDFFDLYFILRSNLLTAKKKDILPYVLKVLNKTEINFETELKQFLPKSHWAIIRNFKQTLRQEIERYVY
jgi:predicted nucleotidyltransferase component of viral defense system